MTMRLIFLDIETTGLNPSKDVPLELAITILNADDLSQIYAVDYIIKQDDVILNKLGHIADNIHGISREEIREGYMPYQIFLAVTDAFDFMKISKENAVFLCQNPAFDRQFFNQIFPPEYTNEIGWPYHWLDLASMFWITEQLPEYMLLSKDNIAERLGLPPEGKPHRAAQGVKHLIRCYVEMYKRSCRAKR
jgi:oligoribonuclease